MRAVIQRAGYARVVVDNELVSEIDGGLLVLVGFKKEESEEDLLKVAQKIVNLRVFEDDAGKMNLSVRDAAGKILCVSQFTLYAGLKKGRRPSFDQAENPDRARLLYETFLRLLEKEGVVVEKGVFGAKMQIELSNQGPVTIFLDSEEL